MRKKKGTKYSYREVVSATIPGRFAPNGPSIITIFSHHHHHHHHPSSLKGNCALWDQG